MNSVSGKGQPVKGREVLMEALTALAASSTRHILHGVSTTSPHLAAKLVTTAASKPKTKQRKAT